MSARAGQSSRVVRRIGGSLVVGNNPTVGATRRRVKRVRALRLTRVHTRDVRARRTRTHTRVALSQTPLHLVHRVEQLPERVNHEQHILQMIDLERLLNHGVQLELAPLTAVTQRIRAIGGR